METVVANSHASLAPTDSTQGLSTAEAAKRLIDSGPNAMPDVSAHPVRSALGKFWAPVPWMLEAVILIELFVHAYVEASVIALLLVFNTVLSFLQESHAQATLMALKSRLALSANVRRDQMWKTIPVKQLVPGDVVKISLGQVVPADVTLLNGLVLLDQSMLTGESVPKEVGKDAKTFAGALVSRGEAVAIVTATGTRTQFGLAAELIRTAHVESSQQKVVFRVVRNLAIYNGVIIGALMIYSYFQGLPANEFLPLILTAILTSIPVALPATFTLSAAIGAKALAKIGVLPTRLSAVDEAASMDILCVDKTGTLTQNALTVTSLKPVTGFDEAHLLAFAALASSDGGQDSVDLAIRTAAQKKVISDQPKLVRFLPFDPASKMSEATVTAADGSLLRIVKGATKVIEALAKPLPEMLAVGNDLENQGFRVLAVAVGPPTSQRLVGFIALSDPPRADSIQLIQELKALGVGVVMVTGDSPITAGIVAKAVGLDGKICPTGTIPNGVKPETFSVFAGVLPEDKFHLVQAFQKAGHTVGMCGDGANDAAALRQAQMGIAVLTATDVAKSAAGIVLTQSGLSGIVASVHEGRVIFQRILTYILKSITHKFVGALFLAIGLFVTGRAVLTPLLLVISMITGDFLSMLAATDNVHVSPTPNVWKVQSLTTAGAILGFCDLIFCTGVLLVGKYKLALNLDALRTLSLVTLIFSGQAIMYVVRERRRMWSSWPSKWLMISSAVDILIISTLSTQGIFMLPIPVKVVASILMAAMLFAFILDTVKVLVFRRLRII